MKHCTEQIMKNLFTKHYKYVVHTTRVSHGFYHFICATLFTNCVQWGYFVLYGFLYVSQTSNFQVKLLSKFCHCLQIVCSVLMTYYIMWLTSQLWHDINRHVCKSQPVMSCVHFHFSLVDSFFIVYKNTLPHGFDLYLTLILHVRLIC